MFGNIINDVLQKTKLKFLRIKYNRNTNPNFTTIYHLKLKTNNIN